MLHLQNAGNQIELTCEIVGYQFPSEPKDDWCLLKVIVTHAERQFKRIDPAIETTELVQLKEWFTCLAERKLPRYAHLTFVEPCISFEFLAYKDDIVRISIQLTHELKPDFTLNQFDMELDDWHIIFDLHQGDFMEILNGIEKALQTYPVRDDE